MDVQTVLGLILGTGGTTVITLIVRGVLTVRRGKVESEETLLRRIDKQSAADSVRVASAETRADRADEEAERQRERFYKEQERASYYRAYMVQMGLKPPKWPPD